MTANAFSDPRNRGKIRDLVREYVIAEGTASLFRICNESASNGWTDSVKDDIINVIKSSEFAGSALSKLIISGGKDDLSFSLKTFMINNLPLSEIFETPLDFFNAVKSSYSDYVELEINTSINKLLKNN